MYILGFIKFRSGVLEPRGSKFFRFAITSSEALPDESMGSNDETILTPVNADNDGN